jgi:hypothetical protein
MIGVLLGALINLVSVVGFAVLLSKLSSRKWTGVVLGALVLLALGFSSFVYVASGEDQTRSLR